MFELVLRAPEAQVELVSDALVNELGALSASVTDADAHTEAEQPLFGEPGMPAPRMGWERSTLTALFDTEAEATAAATLLLAQDWAGDVHVQALTKLAEQDWVRLTQSQFTPVCVTDDFWIVPTWHEPPAQAHRVIRLDPGLAFGTGTHPTTLMCLRWVARQASATGPWPRVLDYGCGSGILAIAAALWMPSTSIRRRFKPAPTTPRPTTWCYKPGCLIRPAALTKWSWPTFWPPL
jgi:ribosomal protein L11 methyltransferase